MVDKPWVPRVTGVVLVGVHRLFALLAVAGGESSLLALTACAPIMSLAGSSGERQPATSAGIAISSQQASIPAALRATPLPATGEVERFDCTSGTPYWHARIAFEAQGGQVLGFAY